MQCSMKEDNCWEDTNYTLFKDSYCPEFTEPVFTGRISQSQGSTVKY